MHAQSLKAAQKARTRAAIVASAARLARERGIVAPSVADVMAAAGLTVGGFYAHFESKEALFEEVIRVTARQTWAELLSGDPRRGAGDVVRDAIHRYLSTEHRDRAAQGCLLPAVTADVARLGGRHRAALRDEVDRCAEALAALDGAGAAPRARALASMAFLYGGLSLARALRGTRLSDEVLAAVREAALSWAGTPRRAPGSSRSPAANRGERACAGWSSRASEPSRRAATTPPALGRTSWRGGAGSPRSRASTPAPTPRGSRGR